MHTCLEYIFASFSIRGGGERMNIRINKVDERDIFDAYPFEIEGHCQRVQSSSL